MARKKSYLPATNHAQLDAIEAALMPAVNKANLKTVIVDGKAMAVADAPLDSLVLAILAVNPVEESRTQSAELVQANADIARRLEKAEGDLAVANATLGGVRTELAGMTNRAETAEATVTRMTSDAQSIDLEMRSLRSENTRITSECNQERTALSELCLEVSCLTDLKDSKGAILPSTATASDKLIAANLIKPQERKAFAKGAINLAASRIGVNVTALPSTTGAQTQAANSRENMVTQYKNLLAEGKSAEAAAFYQANLAK